MIIGFTLGGSSPDKPPEIHPNFPAIVWSLFRSIIRRHSGPVPGLLAALWRGAGVLLYAEGLLCGREGRGPAATRTGWAADETQAPLRPWFSALVTTLLYSRLGCMFPSLCGVLLQNELKTQLQVTDTTDRFTRDTYHRLGVFSK